jgi:hypothetical protein
MQQYYKYSFLCHCFNWWQSIHGKFLGSSKMEKRHCDWIREWNFVIRRQLNRPSTFKFVGYITLIPKKLDTNLAKDFHPISLVHSFAKLITKILANWLAPHLNSIVATNQSAFIRGRSIRDHFILVQQTVKTLQRQKVPSPFLKLDISKAFDSVFWTFLLEVLSHLGFGMMWCNLISNMLLQNGEEENGWNVPCIDIGPKEQYIAGFALPNRRGVPPALGSGIPSGTGGIPLNTAQI